MSRHGGRRSSPNDKQPLDAITADTYGVTMTTRPLVFLLLGTSALAHPTQSKFQQLDPELPTPTEVRTASGRPGPDYWQQRADYVIDVELDDLQQRIVGTERITYTNHSPHDLPYLWVQLDQNRIRPGAEGTLKQTAPDFEDFGYDELAERLAVSVFDSRLALTHVLDGGGQPLPHKIVDTMLRLDLPTPLLPDETTSFDIGWSYAINDGTVIQERTGYEYFEGDGNYIYEIAQWYPRMAAYTDVTGWQNKQFLGRGEFALEYGDFTVRITVPADHIVGATGVLTNPGEVLSDKQRARLETARSAPSPVHIVTPAEARRNQKAATRDKATWVFEAENVRDFAFASSRKFVWDAWGHETSDGNTVMAMSMFPPEGDPLWSQYSTHAIVHALEVYERFTFPYPYPVAMSVNGPVGGMEYPMISFNRPRPEEDGTYAYRADEQHAWKHSKFGLIGVVIHEVGHNWFPMMLNNDERQWTWLDEGLNTFVQAYAQREWEANYPSDRGEPADAIAYMPLAIEPIMTDSDAIVDFGESQYMKTATALSILRESILGPEVFDFAFRQYAAAWKFKRPYPADFFRIMEDAAGRDLDWFWRGWFFTTDHVDMAITDVYRYTLETRDPNIDKHRARLREGDAPKSVQVTRAEGVETRLDRYPELADFYHRFDRWNVTRADRQAYRELLETLDDNQEQLLKTDKIFYAISIENIGGLVMPVVLQITWEDGRVQELRLPAEIWMEDSTHVTKLLLADKEIQEILLDPSLEMADADMSDNAWPRKAIEETFQLRGPELEPNTMQTEQSP